MLSPDLSIDYITICDSMTSRVKQKDELYTVWQYVTGKKTIRIITIEHASWRCGQNSTGVPIRKGSSRGEFRYSVNPAVWWEKWRGVVYNVYIPRTVISLDCHEVILQWDSVFTFFIDDNVLFGKVLFEGCYSFAGSFFYWPVNTVVRRFYCDQMH